MKSFLLFSFFLSSFLASFIYLFILNGNGGQLLQFPRATDRLKIFTTLPELMVQNGRTKDEGKGKRVNI